MDWEEEDGSEEVRRNDKDTNRATTADKASEANQGPGQMLDQDFSKKLDIMKSEFQLDFTKLRDRMTEEVAKMTLSQAQEELSQACSELEHTRLQLHALTGAQGNLSVRIVYADVARRTPPVRIPTPASSTGRAATPEPTFCTVDMSRVLEEQAS